MQSASAPRTWKVPGMATRSWISSSRANSATFGCVAVYKNNTNTNTAAPASDLVFNFILFVRISNFFSHYFDVDTFTLRLNKELELELELY